MTQKLIAQDLRHVWHPFTQADEWEKTPPLVIESGRGALLRDTEGREYIDAISSLWVGIHGHRHPVVDAAVRAQLDRVAHSTMLGLANAPAVKLASALAQRTGYDRVFYSDCGSSAVEIALKLAFQWQQQRGETQRTVLAGLDHAYHGDTLGAVSVGGIDLFHAVYRPLLFDAVHLPCPGDRLDETRFAEQAVAGIRAQGDTLAAVIVEPFVQGAAGMRMHTAAYLEPVLAAAHEVGALVISDEVAVGMGRLGHFRASERLSIKPDLVCLGKGLSNGYLPLAATLATEALYDGFRGGYDRTFFHGHTFTGNPLACAAGLACLELFESEGTLSHVRAMATHLEQLLSAPLPHVTSIRQDGLMVGIDLEPWLGARTGHQVCATARAHGVLLRPLGDTVVLMPPLCVSKEQLGSVVQALTRTLESL
jgi:adenosylmethionine---8-amino-7-oxononanoate aminotransferase